MVFIPYFCDVENSVDHLVVRSVDGLWDSILSDLLSSHVVLDLNAGFKSATGNEWYSINFFRCAHAPCILSNWGTLRGRSHGYFSLHFKSGKWGWVNFIQNLFTRMWSADSSFFLLQHVMGGHMCSKLDRLSFISVINSQFAFKYCITTQVGSKKL